MKREKIDVLRDEIHIPDVVMNAAEDAFSKIKLEASASQKQNTAEVKMMKKPVGFKKKWIAFAMVAVLAIGTLSVGAATNFQWFQAYTDVLEISEDDKAMLEENGMLAGVGQSVTDHDITITLEGYICDRMSAYILYSVEGIDPPKEGQNIRLVGSTSAGFTSGSSSTYLGQDPETGKLLCLENIQTSANGRMDSGYMFSYFTGVEVWDEGGMTPALSKDGEWNFKIQLTENTAVITYVANVPLNNGVATLKEVVLSPISMEYTVQYDSDYYYESAERIKEAFDNAVVDDECNIKMDETHYNVDIYGFLMKDGTIESPNGGGSGSWRLLATSTYSMGKVIDVDNISALLVADEKFNSDDGISVEDFEQIPLENLTLVVK